MVGLGLQVAKGLVTIDELREMISNPNVEKLLPPNVQHHKCMKAPPEGLTYVGGEYDPAIIGEETDDVTRLPVGPEPARENWRPKILWHDKEFEDRVMALTMPIDEEERQTPARVKGQKECNEILRKSQQTEIE